MAKNMKDFLYEIFINEAKPALKRHSSGEGYDEGFEKGKISFIDNFIDNIGGTSMYGFGGKGWSNDSFKPTKDLCPTNAQGMFIYSPITNLAELLRANNVKLDTSKCTNFATAFAYSDITHIPEIDTTSSTTSNATFLHANDLVVIEKIILQEASTFMYGSSQQNFAYCGKLEEISFNEGGTFIGNVSFAWSTKLTLQSLINILNAMHDVSNTDKAGTCTLTLAKQSKSLLDTNNVTITHKTTGVEYNWQDYIIAIGWQLA